MALLVKKFGGTSVGSVERIQIVAQLALDSWEKGDQVVLVVSAMSGETNRLDQLAKEIDPSPYSLAYDTLIASGEQVSIGLLSLAINKEAEKRGLITQAEVKSRPMLGYQIGILTDNIYSKARIKKIDTAFLTAELEKGCIPVIAGFQGVDREKNITTLGRGGSDTSAVAIAAALKADVCEIYTDVDGVYTTDPRMHDGAKKLEKISYDEMMELSSLGAKVLQIRSVELAAKHRLPIHVRSSFYPERSGTWVVPQDHLGESMMEQVDVAGVVSDTEQVKFTLQNVPDQPGVAAKIFGVLSKASVVVDVIVQDVSPSGLLNVSFTVGQKDFLAAQESLSSLVKNHFPDMRVSQEQNLAKVSIVGVGMQHHPGVASKMFEILAENGINIKLITTSEIKVSCLIDEDYVKKAVTCLHKGFHLED